MKNFLSKFKHFARDLIILVLGIVLSLMLNDWRENRSNRADEIRVVKQMVEDLVRDTTDLAEGLEGLSSISELTEFLLGDGALMPDSLLDAGMSMWSMATYIPIVLQKTAFNELTYQDQHRNIRFPELASSFINLHEGTYSLLEEVIDLHAKYLIEDLVPFLNSIMPPVKVLLEADPSRLEIIEKQLRSYEMQNRIEWVDTLLLNVDGVMREAKAEASKLLVEIKEKYNL
ncbi:MAG: hypothetical protein AAF741_14715 [Bacteroidota bacterium]